jgi:hypothetical protein
MCRLAWLLKLVAKALCYRPIITISKTVSLIITMDEWNSKYYKSIIVIKVKDERYLFDFIQNLF